MSGPISVVVAVNPVPALLAAAAIRAAVAVYQGYEKAGALRAQHQADNKAREAQTNEANLRGREAMQEDAKQTEAAIEQLIVLADQLGIADKVRATRPQAPASDDPESRIAYLRGLQALTAELRSILLTEAARVLDENIETAGGLVISAEIAGAPPKRLAQRLLARIAHLGAPPENIRKLAYELDNMLPGDRADLLATELRSQIQKHIEALQQQAVQEATAIIVEQSLKDLGYQVEEISNTLFVEGGVVHFRRQGWGDYMVRMRVNAGGAGANFNVVRAAKEGDTGHSAQDHIAEDRWCAEFPALLKALEVRGVKLDVTRRLAAGELPVQQVDPARLPQFADEEVQTSSKVLRAREIK